MAPKLLSLPILSLLLILSTANMNSTAAAGSLYPANETLDWQLQRHYHLELEEGSDGEDESSQRRSLYWHPNSKPKRYYISYGALSANRVPCPPRSGRSYYTHNCFNARGPVHPYSRGCSAITRCRR